MGLHLHRKENQLRADELLIRPSIGKLSILTRG
jgi:hypothetical protein